jgi:hypothetical protein
MARCPKCLILEGTEGARFCAIAGCPQVFAELDRGAVSTALKAPANSTPRRRPKRVSYSEFLADDTTDSESDNQSGISQPESQPDVIAAQPPVRTSARRPRKTTAPVTVYDRDAGVGEVPTNLR